MPANSAPLARATLASRDKAPKLMSDTKIGMSRWSGLAADGPTIEIRCHDGIVEQRQRGELGGHELDRVPRRQLLARHPHRCNRPVLPGNPAIGELADETHVRFLRRPGRILERPLVRITSVGLRVAQPPLLDLVGVDPHRAVVDPRRESLEPLFVVVLRDAAAVAIVPMVETADEIVAFDMPVTEQRSSVEAAPVQDGHVLTNAPADDDQIDATHERVGRAKQLQLIPRDDAFGPHGTSSARTTLRETTNTGADTFPRHAQPGSRRYQ